jgi:hypothetical protein
MAHPVGVTLAFPGVWSANIDYGRIRIYLGSYTTEIDAERDYLRACDEREAREISALSMPGGFNPRAPLVGRKISWARIQRAFRFGNNFRPDIASSVHPGWPWPESLGVPIQKGI